MKNNIAKVTKRQDIVQFCDCFDEKYFQQFHSVYHTCYKKKKTENTKESINLDKLSVLME